MCLGIPDKPVSGCEQPAGSVGRSSGSDGPHCPSPGPSASHTAHSWGSVRRALKDATLLRLQGEAKDKAAAFHSPSRAFRPFAEAGPPLEKPVGTVRPGGFLHTRRCCPEALSLREASVPSCCQPHARPDATVKTGAGAGFARAGLGGHVGRGFHLSADHGGGSAVRPPLTPRVSPLLTPAGSTSLPKALVFCAFGILRLLPDSLSRISYSPIFKNSTVTKLYLRGFVFLPRPPTQINTICSPCQFAPSP